MGFPVAEVAAHHWANWVAALRDAGRELGGDLLIDGHAPKCGQVFRNPALAQTLKVNILNKNTHTKNRFVDHVRSTGESFLNCYFEKKQTEQCRTPETRLHGFHFLSVVVCFLQKSLSLLYRKTLDESGGTVGN